MSSENRGMSSAAKMAQLGHAVATIINGALTGGIKGAAIAAAKSFLPQLLKAIAYGFLLVILLPFFLFLSLICPTFQFPSVADAEVQAMNTQAAAVGGYYKNFDLYTRLEADAIIAELSKGYDDTEVTEDFGYTNHNWLTVISSVQHNQDLFAISEDGVREIVRRNIEYSYWVETYYDEDDEEERNPLQRIHIDLWDIGPQALIGKLGFDEFHIEWAGFLYDNLTESQTIDPDHPDYTGDMPGVEIGDLSFSDGGREVVY